MALGIGVGDAQAIRAAFLTSDEQAGGALGPARPFDSLELLGDRLRGNGPDSPTDGSRAPQRVTAVEALVAGAVADRDVPALVTERGVAGELGEHRVLTGLVRGGGLAGGHRRGRRGRRRGRGAG